MPDRLYLSIWTRNPSPLTIHERLATLLRTFPFSRLQPNLELTVHGVSMSEPVLLEQSFQGSDQWEDLFGALEAWRSPDAALEVEGAWDLLQPEGSEWKLTPSRVNLLAFGPEFERGDNDDDLRIEFGRESLFLPEAESPQSFKMVEGNIRSLLKLVADVEGALPVQKRLLWSESGGNFAERLAELTGR
jgi:hypothetical protein